MKTYADLKDLLNRLAPEELEKPITMLLLDAGEFVNPLEQMPIAFADETDNLPYGTPYFLI